jgi:peptidoglycan hydrolase CwlO-like protein
MIDYTKTQTAIATMAQFFQALNDTNETLGALGGLEAKAAELTKAVADLQDLASAMKDSNARAVAESEATLADVKTEHDNLMDAIKVASAELMGIKEAIAQKPADPVVAEPTPSEVTPVAA